MVIFSSSYLSVKVTGKVTLRLLTRRRIVSGCLGESHGQHTQGTREMQTEFPPSTSVNKRYYVHSINVSSCLLDRMAIKATIQRGQRPTVVDNIFETHIFVGASEHLGQQWT
jgi:hypothetical protein